MSVTETELVKLGYKVVVANIDGIVFNGNPYQLQFVHMERDLRKAPSFALQIHWMFKDKEGKGVIRIVKETTDVIEFCICFIE